jgi:four helix bundle protein
MMGEERTFSPRVKDLAFKFALSLIEFLKTLPRGTIERELLRQLVRSGTSIGANIEEATGARTQAEFVNSMNIAKREARETLYWLRLFEAMQPAAQAPMRDLLAQAEALLRMLTAIVKTSETRRF